MRVLPVLTVCLPIVAALAVPAQSEEACELTGEAQLGEHEARACRGCHVFDVDKRARPTGPNLATIYGARAGQSEDFKRYSQGLKLLADKGLVWNERNLDAYIKAPQPFLEATTGIAGVKHGMAFNMPDAAKRAQVIAYLKSLAECAKRKKK